MGILSAVLQAVTGAANGARDVSAGVLNSTASGSVPGGGAAAGAATAAAGGAGGAGSDDGDDSILDDLEKAWNFLREDEDFEKVRPVVEPLVQKALEESVKKSLNWPKFPSAPKPVSHALDAVQAVNKTVTSAIQDRRRMNRTKAIGPDTREMERLAAEHTARETARVEQEIAKKASKLSWSDWFKKQLTLPKNRDK